jgi:hypothetical protein
VRVVVNNFSEKIALAMFDTSVPLHVTEHYVLSLFCHIKSVVELFFQMLGMNGLSCYCTESNKGY